MVRKAVRTYSQIVTDFAKADEEDARIRAYYEPSSSPAAVRPSADPDAQQKRPVSAARKHRYAHTLDWNDDVSAIVNVDKHDGGARAGAPAAAFAADRKGTASRALTAALTAAMETASRLSPAPVPTTTHTSRLAMRLLRAAQAPLPMPSTSPPGSTTQTPRPEAPASPGAVADPHQPWRPPSPTAGGSQRSVSPSSRPGSPTAGGRGAGAPPTPSVPSGSAYLDIEEQQELAIANGTLLSSSARMLYYGSTKPRASSARGRPPSGVFGGGGGSTVGSGSNRSSGRGSRPFSAPSTQQPPSSSVVLQLPMGRASLTASWVQSPARSGRPASAAVGHRVSYSPPVSPSGAATSARRRSSNISAVTPMFQVNGAAVPLSPASVRQSVARTSHSSFAAASLPQQGGGCDDAEAAAAAAAATVSAETARSLGINPRQLQQTQPKRGPSNGLVLRDPVGPQLVPNRRVTVPRPFSAPPGGGPAAMMPDSPGSLYGGGGGGAAAAAAAQQGQVSFRPPSPSWQPQPQWHVSSSSPPRGQGGGGGGAGGGNTSPPRQLAWSPTRGGTGMRREDSYRSVASARTGVSQPMSQPSGGSVAVAAAAAAAAAAVNAGVSMQRRRHAALTGARKALWSQIADTAGVAPYEIQDQDGALDVYDESGGGGGGSTRPVGAGSSPYLAAYLAQQAAAGPSSGASSRTHSRLGSPDHLRSAKNLHRHNRASESDGGFGVEPSAAYLLASGSAAASAADAGDDGASAVTHGSRRGSEQGGGSAGRGEGAPPRRAGSGGQGSVLRTPSVIKRAQLGGTGGGGGGGDDDGGDAAATPSGSKRVQWGANVWSPRHRLPQSPAGSPAGLDGVSELDRVSSGFQRSSSGGEGGGGGGASDGGMAGLGRPPRYPVPSPLSISSGGAAADGVDLALAAGLISPVNSISPAFYGGIGGGIGGGGSSSAGGGHGSSGRRRGGGAAASSGLRGTPEAGSEDGDADLPSLEVSTAAGHLDRPHQSPKAAGGAATSAASGPLPSFTEPEFYHLTALVGCSEDVQGWLFNVYLTDIVPGNPVARRVCIATCTTADPLKRLLVPSPALTAAARGPRPASAPATSATSRTLPSSLSSSSRQPAAAPWAPPSPLISPAELLPWISRPEQLFGHWVRLEAFAIAPVADKVVDAVTFMGRLDNDMPPPPQPKLSKLQIVDVRLAAGTGAAAHGGGGGGMGGEGGAAGVGPGDGGGGARPVLVAALGRQVSSAGTAALAQARLAAEVTLSGRQRPASARPRGTTWALQTSPPPALSRT